MPKPEAEALCFLRLSLRFWGKLPKVPPLFLRIQLAQLPFGPLQNPQPLARKVLSRAIDIEVEHRHRGLEGPSLALRAAFGRALQRRGDPGRAGLGKDSRIEIERMAVLCDILRPTLGRGHGLTTRRCAFAARRCRSFVRTAW